jgi:DAACS family dicarboxylate/amino acid:cation (Na+ or H+) symporter
MPDSKRQVPLHTKVLIGLVVGLVAGLVCQGVLGSDNQSLAGFVKNVTYPVGQVFLRMIFMVVVPLLFSALVLGVAEIGDAKAVGRVGVRSLALTLVLSTIAVLIGLVLVNTFRPGDGVDAAKRAQLVATYANPSKAQESIEQSKEAKTLADTLLEIVPRNPLVEAHRALEGGLLPLMFFALVFGLGMAAAPSEKVATVKSFFEGIFAISLKVIDFAMKLAPFGVAALVFGAISLLGFDAIAAMGRYVVIVLFGLAFHQFVVYAIALKLIAKREPRQFFRDIRPIMVTAFATSSSNATLPTALQVSQENLKLPRDISSFVLTVGATANQNGTALFEGVTVLFLAQFFGVELTLAQQFGVMGLAVVAGIGTAGVPGGAWPMIAIILAKFGVPPESIGLVIGIRPDSGHEQNRAERDRRRDDRNLRCSNGASALGGFGKLKLGGIFSTSLGG